MLTLLTDHPDYGFLPEYDQFLAFKLCHLVAVRAKEHAVAFLHGHGLVKAVIVNASWPTGDDSAYVFMVVIRCPRNDYAAFAHDFLVGANNHNVRTRLDMHGRVLLLSCEALESQHWHQQEVRAAARSRQRAHGLPLSQDRRSSNQTHDLQLRHGVN